MDYLSARNIFISHVNSYGAKKTISYYDITLSLFERFLLMRFGCLDFPVSKLSKQHFVDYIIFCRDRGVKNTSVRNYARGVKAFLRFLWLEGHIDKNITLNVKFPKDDSSPVVPLSSLRVARLFKAIDDSPLALRNRALFSLMLDCGLRVGEVCRLNISDIDFENNYVAIVDTKCNKSRIVPLPTKVRKYILDYINTINCDCMPCPVFRDKLGVERITENCVKVFMNRLKKVDGDIHCHLLRHTFATSFVMGGGQLECLRLLMGHETYDVTRKYLHLSTQMMILNFDVYRLDGCMFSLNRTYDGLSGTKVPFTK